MEGKPGDIKGNSGPEWDIMNRPVATLAAIGVLVLAGCGSGDSGQGEATTATTPIRGSSTSSKTSVPATPQLAEDATTSAMKIKAEVTTVTKVVTITEDNDPNDKIGRPGGYISAAVLYEKSVKCSDGLGADCGATLEVYASPAEAKARAAYLQKIHKDIQMLGSEYNYVREGALLRVSGDVKPSAAKKYNAAFGGVLFK